jgi:hypothetical protein
MVAALRNDFIEAFEDQDNEEFSVDHYLDKFESSKEGPTEGEEPEYPTEGEELEGPTEGEELEGPTEPEELEEPEEKTIMQNNSVVEGFNGSKVIELNNEKVWLKSIMFGLLFYILSNPKIYDLTKGLSSQINKHVLHTLIFVVITYFLLIIV